MRTILVVGGGYAGFYTAWKLEKKLRRDEAKVVVVDPRPYLTYQPFLPEVVAGSVEARHAAAVRPIIGKKGYDGAFDKPLSKKAVLAAATPFLA